MSLTSSNMLPLGANAPKFDLIDTLSKQTKSYKSLKRPKGMLVMFICNHCPYVLHIQESLVAVGNKYLELGIGVVAISSNDIVAYPEDDPVKMEQFALNLGFKFPYLYDENQAVARSYEAACTPDFYLFDHILVMDKKNFTDVTALAPDDLKAKISLFLDYSSMAKESGLLEVPDPYYGGDDGLTI